MEWKEITLRGNKLRELLNHDKATLGTHFLCPWPGMVEVIAAAGQVDYVEFSGEYAPYDLHDLENIARACDASGLSSMMKLDQQPRTFLAQRALGSGIQNLLFADVRSLEDAEECIVAVKMETPEDGGNHGCHMRRSVGYVLDAGTTQYVRAMKNTVIAFMIEKKPTLDNLEDILAVKGVDMIQFGPCDYAISIGVPGQWHHSKVKAAELKAIKTALRMDIRPRVELDWGFTVADVQKYTDLGVRDFCIGTDVMIVYGWIKDNLSKIRKLNL
jgi:2-keto-3-deoxy-L-rhamnonate aldolase RhmA